MIKEREELIQLLIKIDQFRFKAADETSRSERRIIKILRAGMKPSRGLKEAIDSVQEKYPWKTGKIVVKSAISVVMCLLGCFLYASDIASDWHFYSNLDQNEKAVRIATMIHIILPFAFAILVFLTLLSSKFLKLDVNLLFKMPLPPFTKLSKAIIESRLYVMQCRCARSFCKKEESSLNISCKKSYIMSYFGI